MRLAGMAAGMAIIVATPLAAQQQMTSDGYALLEAVRAKDGAKVDGLLPSINPILANTKDRTSGEGVLHIVVKRRDLPWLGYLIGKGARPDMQDRQGATPLSVAAQIGWVDGAQRLLTGRARVDLANMRGETPLMLAVMNRDAAMVRLLLANGANARKSDNVTGYSAIDHAKRDARAAAIVKLLEAPPEKPKSLYGP